MPRTPKVTVAWCRDCKMGSILKEEIGGSCWNADCPRTLIKRVGYVCPELIPWSSGFTVKCEMVHWTVKSMKECQHDAY